MRKNPHAVALGRKGGKAFARLPFAERSRIGQLGGRPAKYRLVNDVLCQASDIPGVWQAVPQPDSRAAREALRRLRASS